MRFLDDFLFVNQPISFTSSFHVDEAVERLREASARWRLRVLFKQAIIGTVSRDEVVLARSIPFCHNDFAPRFYGSFREENGNAVLEGQFSTPPRTRKGMIFFLGYSLCFLLLFTFAFFTGNLQRSPGATPSSDWVAVAIPSGMLLFAIYLAKPGRWFGRNDPAFISKRICDALQCEVAAGDLRRADEPFTASAQPGCDANP